MKRILFVHQNFPGQYRHVAAALAARPGVEVVALSWNGAPDIAGVRVIRCTTERRQTVGIHPWVADVEVKVIRGEGAMRAAQALRAEGFVPDVICAHTGWGEPMFLREVFPATPMLGFCEWFYRGHGGDVGFDREFSDPDEDQLAKLRLRNAHSLVSLDACDWAISPTQWQRSTYPQAWRPRISVIHDGIDTDRLRPNPGVRVNFGPDHRPASPGDEIITYVSRSLEPYRGFHIFMRALPEVLRRRPNARVLIIGGEGVSYGSRLADGRSHKQMMLDELKGSIDLSRVHFLGRISHPQYIAALQVSAVHVYLSYPFVLSWSMLEAMAAGCLVVGSATPPVQEIIQDGENGLLVDFFDPGAIARAIDSVLDHPDRMASARRRARQTVEAKYDLRRVCLPHQLALIDDVAAGRLPPGGSIESSPGAADRV